MKKYTHITALFSLTLALVFSLAGMTQASAKKLDLDFTVHNETGVVIHKLFITPHSSDKWDENVLGDKLLKDGESFEITFSPKETAEKWDIRVEDADGNPIEWENLKLSEITDVTLHYKNGKATADLKNGDE